MVGATEENNTLSLGGVVIPYREVTLSAQTPGRIEYIAGREGNWFNSTSTLIAIDNDDLLARRRSAMAELQNAQSTLQNAQVQYSRELLAPRSKSVSQMPGMGMPSLFDQFFTRGFAQNMGYGNPWLERQADLVNSSTSVNSALGRIHTARSNIEMIDASLRDTRALAPFPGIIAKKHVEIGDTVQPGQPLMDFVDNRYLQIQVDVPARLMSGLRIGMPVQAKLDIGPTYVEARLAQIFPIADSKRHTVVVKFDLPAGVPGGPGMYAEVLVPDNTKQNESLPVIPKNAVLSRGSLPIVFVINDQQQTELRLVRLGDELDNQNVLVLSGLAIGERIVTNPPANMKAGDPLHGK